MGNTLPRFERLSYAEGGIKEGDVIKVREFTHEEPWLSSSFPGATKLDGLYNAYTSFGLVAVLSSYLGGYYGAKASFPRMMVSAVVAGFTSSECIRLSNSMSAQYLFCSAFDGTQFDLGEKWTRVEFVKSNDETFRDQIACYRIERINDRTFSR